MSSFPADAATTPDARDAPAAGAAAVDDVRADGADGADGGPPSAPAGDAGSTRPRRPWGRIAAIVSLVYIAWYVIGLGVLQRSPAAYNALNRFYGSIGARIALCLVLLAVLFHLLDGVRVTLQDALPHFAPHEIGLRTAVRFALLAAWIPAAVTVLWPAIRTWFSR